MHQRRRLQPDRHVRGRHEPRHGPGAGAKPRQPGPADACPSEVKQTGVSVKKKSPNILLVVNLVSPKGTYDQLYLSNYATIQIRDELAQIKGVGDVTYLRPARLQHAGLARSGADGGPQPVGQRRGRRAARAKRASGGRLARPPAGAARGRPFSTR